MGWWKLDIIQASDRERWKNRTISPMSPKQCGLVCSSKIVSIECILDNVSHSPLMASVRTL